MANNIPTNGAGLLSAIFSPSENWAARSAARSEAVQLQGYLTAQKEAEVLAEQQAAVATEEQLQAFAALPFFGRDKQKASAFFKQEEKGVFERLNDTYQGNYKRWYDAEFKSWSAGATRRLQQSPFYQQAVENRRNVGLAQMARERGEFLVGSVGPNGYQGGEQDLQDFLTGKADVYRLRGTHKAEDSLRELREQFAPGVEPWRQVAVSEEAKLSHLINKYGEEVGKDKYYRQYAGVETMYRVSPITDKFDFERKQVELGLSVGRFGLDQARLGMEGQRLNMARQEQADGRVIRGLQAQGLQLSNAKKLQELTGTEPGGSGRPYDQDRLSYPSVKVDLKHDASGNKVLPNSKINISQIKTIAGTDLLGDDYDVFIRKLGIIQTKDGYSKGTITEGWTDQNGVQAINLKGVNFTPVAIDPRIYYNPADVSGTGLNPNGVKGYARVTVKFANADAAALAGLYDPNRLPFSDRKDATGIFDSQTKLGAGVYDPATMTATFYTPAGFVDAKPFIKALQKSSMGQKAANESQVDAPYTPKPNY